MTDHDLELIDLASSTTYRDSILKYIDEAESEECKSILIDILNNSETTWE